MRFGKIAPASRSFKCFSGIPATGTPSGALFMRGTPSDPLEKNLLGEEYPAKK
jgi:hypothetical protein